MMNTSYTEVPQGKYNKWCERKELVCCDEKRKQAAEIYIMDNSLTASEKAVYYAHELVNCQGLEFVGFSNARINQTVNLPGNITIVPCFNTGSINDNKHLDSFTSEMERRGIFIYDGWLPIDEWNKNGVRKAIISIYSALSIFATRASAWFSWEPKYSPFSKGGIWYEFKQGDIGLINRLTEFTNQLTELDAQALLRSIGWLSQSLKIDEPSGKFLFGIVAIESLANYIEDNPSEESVFKSLRCEKTNRKERKMQKEDCIKEVMSQLLDKDPINAVNEAYLNCVYGIKKGLKLHMENVFKEETGAVGLLFNIKVGEKTLWDLRNDIAHGRFNTLSEEQREVINIRAWDVERIARDYIIRVLRVVSGQDLPEYEITESISGLLEDCVFSNPNMYHGPIHMAEVYSSQYKGMITGGW